MVKGRLSGLKKRSPVVNGIFYPESPVAMIKKLSAWGLKENYAASGGKTILAPHGAWELTGDIAARAFAGVQKRITGRKINRVLMLGTYHHSSEEGIYLSESSSFVTPLGDLKVDQELNYRLASCSTLIKANDVPHLCEHSLEVLLPLVKFCFNDAMIVPILMSGRKPALISALAGALKITMEDRIDETLIILSSTISQNADPVKAESMAKNFCELIGNNDAGTYMSRLREGRISACGGGLIGAMLESRLLGAKHFSPLLPMSQGKEDHGETVYYGAFSDFEVP